MKYDDETFTVHFIYNVTGNEGMIHTLVIEFKVSNRLAHFIQSPLTDLPLTFAFLSTTAKTTSFP